MSKLLSFSGVTVMLDGDQGGKGWFVYPKGERA